MRAALGAGRGRLVRQLLIESTLLSVLGGALGIGLAALGTRLLLALNPNMLTEWFKVRDRWRQFCSSSVALSIGTGILFGVIPAFRCVFAGTRPQQLAARRRPGCEAAAAAAARTCAGLLVVAQVGLGRWCCLVGAGLLIRSFGELTRVHLGFNESHVADLPSCARRGSATTPPLPSTRSLMAS